MAVLYVSILFNTRIIHVHYMLLTVMRSYYCSENQDGAVHRNFLWPPYGIGQAIIFSSCGFFFLLLSSSIFFLAYSHPLQNW